MREIKGNLENYIPFWSQACFFNENEVEMVSSLL